MQLAVKVIIFADFFIVTWLASIFLSTACIFLLRHTSDDKPGRAPLIGLVLHRGYFRHDPGALL